MSVQLSIFTENNILSHWYSPRPKYFNDEKIKVVPEVVIEKVAKQVKPFYDVIPKLAIHPNRIVQYNEVKWIPHRPVRKNQTDSNSNNSIQYAHLLTSKRTAAGAVSDIARRKMGKAIEYLLFLANPKTATSQLTGRLFSFRIAFITLTLPSAQKHTDNEIKKTLLNSFLLELKDSYKVKNYFWRAEKQLNGNIHFHLIVDKFIAWNELRNRWNRILNKLGYVDNYRNEMKKFHRNGFAVREKLLKKWSYKAQINAYKTGVANDWSSPNSTDIHSIKKIRDIQKYLSKYMTKNEEKEFRNKVEYKILLLKESLKNLKKSKKRKKLRTLKRLRILRKKLLNKVQQGRIWGCNRSLSNPTGAQLVIDNKIWDELNSLVEQSHCNIYEAEHFSVMSVDFNTLVKNNSGTLFREFVKYMGAEFGFEYQTAMQY